MLAGDDGAVEEGVVVGRLQVLDLRLGGTADLDALAGLQSDDTTVVTDVGSQCDGNGWKAVSYRRDVTRATELTIWRRRWTLGSGCHGIAGREGEGADVEERRHVCDETRGSGCGCVWSVIGSESAAGARQRVDQLLVDGVGVGVGGAKRVCWRVRRGCGTKRPSNGRAEK